MTGIERLREVVSELGRFSFCYDLYKTLDNIADQIEREHNVADREEHDATAWAREHGGLETVEARLMPEGYEWLLDVWPKWSNGEYCKFGDWWKSDKYGEHEPNQFRKLSIYTPEQLREWGQDDGDNYGYEWDFVRPSDPKYRPDKVEPPVPKVLDADGVEIYEGRIAYGTRGRKYRVTALCEYEPSIVHAQALDDAEMGDEFIAANTGLNSYQLDASKLTHERPVLAADGKPLEVGQTVYAKNYGYVKCTVLAIEWVVDGYLVEVENEGGHKFRQTPDEFTHRRPVLDADGVEIRKGDTVWHVHDLDKFTVTNPNNGENLSVSCMGEDGKEYCCYPNGLTHRAPVLAADGRPLREGEMVYHIESGDEFTVMGVDAESGDAHVRWGYDFEDKSGSIAAKLLTHERPVADSFEQLEKDANDLIYDIGFHLGDYSPSDFQEEGDSVQDRVRDLVRRARALAGVSE